MNLVRSLVVLLVLSLPSLSQADPIIYELADDSFVSLEIGIDESFVGLTQLKAEYISYWTLTTTNLLGPAFTLSSDSGGTVVDWYESYVGANRVTPLGAEFVNYVIPFTETPDDFVLNFSGTVPSTGTVANFQLYGTYVIIQGGFGTAEGHAEFIAANIDGRAFDGVTVGANGFGFRRVDSVSVPEPGTLVLLGLGLLGMMAARPKATV